jgi:hypothetical protein
MGRVVANTIGFIGIHDFAPPQWATVVVAIKIDLVPIAERDLRPRPEFDRDGALRQVRDLAATAVDLGVEWRQPP